MTSDDSKGEKTDSSVETKYDRIEEKTTNFLFGVMTLATIIGSSFMLYQLKDFATPLIAANLDYKFPQLFDFLQILKICPIIIIAKLIIEKLARPLCERMLAKKYLDPSDEVNFALGRIYIKKQATNIYKLIFFTCTTAFGYSILKQLDYFPVSLGGFGSINKMWEAGYPNCYHHWKPEYFDIYYLTGLAFCITDLIWLVFVYELQSDFIVMIFHHFCTISLITFSFLSNYSNIGSIVLFLHDAGDIVVYFSRITVYVDVTWKKQLIGITGAILLTIFIYTRIYVLGKVLESIYYDITWEWKWVTKSLFSFLCFLFVMHLNWIYLILKKYFGAILNDKFEDTASINKVKVHNSKIK